MTLPGTPSWPERFEVLNPAPSFLARRGPAIAGGAAAVAIVGQRRATPYGREVAGWLADSLARAGVVVVSGGAVGIDAAAHRAAVDAGGRTTVVLGCGHSVDYPRVHARDGGLFEQVRDAGGCLVSESLPTEQPKAFRVLARNRLVAALSDVVVVVEGGARSGALNTASHAADQGVGVLAVPGDVRAAGSAAPLRLLAEGCAPCRGPQDVLALLGGQVMVGMDQTDDPTTLNAGLPPELVGILGSAFPRPVPLDDLARQSGLATGTVLAAVTRGRIAGVLASDASGIRLRRRPPPTGVRPSNA